MTLDSAWPGGYGTPSAVTGRCRDLLTLADGSAQVLAEDSLRARAAPDRTILDISSDPPRAEVREIVGTRAGGRLRGVLADVVPGELSAGTPLHLLLDDLSGATLVAPFAFAQWPEYSRDWMTTSQGGRREPRRMEGICIGFRPGSSSLLPDGTSRMSHDYRAVQPLESVSDPLGWHELYQPGEQVSHRRARRIDVWRSGVLRVDAFFQDSATSADRRRIAVHEYTISATVSPKTFEVLSIEATPRVLPYAECPAAVAHVRRIVGSSAGHLRQTVLENFKTTHGCTHLNDTMRALAEVPVLARALSNSRED